MNRDLEYTFQHFLLPRFFNEQKETFVAVALKEPNFLYDLLNMLCNDQNEENPYSKEDFKSEPIKFTKDILVLALTFPKPKDIPLCYKQYIFFDWEYEHTQYFCIEKTIGDEEGLSPCVCSWDGEKHNNYGRVEMKYEDSDLIRCAEIFSRNAFGRELKDLLREEFGEE